eukprot:scaffold14023_cov127-Skeletonema_menzelii.AAC.4
MSVSVAARSAAGVWGGLAVYVAWRRSAAAGYLSKRFETSTVSPTTAESRSNSANPSTHHARPENKRSELLLQLKAP